VNRRVKSNLLRIFMFAVLAAPLAGALVFAIGPRQSQTCIPDDSGANLFGGTKCFDYEDWTGAVGPALILYVGSVGIVGGIVARRRD
jgi:hypothetical protein